MSSKPLAPVLRGHTRLQCRLCRHFGPALAERIIDTVGCDDKLFRRLAKWLRRVERYRESQNDPRA